MAKKVPDERSKLLSYDHISEISPLVSLGKLREEMVSVVSEGFYGQSRPCDADIAKSMGLSEDTVQALDKLAR